VVSDYENGAVTRPVVEFFQDNARRDTSRKVRRDAADRARTAGRQTDRRGSPSANFILNDHDWDLISRPIYDSRTLADRQFHDALSSQELLLHT